MSLPLFFLKLIAASAVKRNCMRLTKRGIGKGGRSMLSRWTLHAWKASPVKVSCHETCDGQHATVGAAGHAVNEARDLSARCTRLTLTNHKIAPLQTCPNSCDGLNLRRSACCGVNQSRKLPSAWRNHGETTQTSVKRRWSRTRE